MAGPSAAGSGGKRSQGAAAKRKKAKEEPTVESLTEELNYLREVLESTEDNRQTLIKHKRAKEMALEKALKELSEAKVTIKVLEATGKGSMGVQSSGSVYSEELKARNQLITEYEQTIHAQEREIAKLKGIEKEWEESLAPGKDDDYIDEHTFGSN